MNQTRITAALAPVVLMLAMTPTLAGDVVGHTRYTGTPPEKKQVSISKDKAVCAKTPQYEGSLVVSADKGVKNVVVSLTDVKDGKKMPVLSNNPDLDQNGCKFNPRVQIIAAGQELDILNSDGILHNIHTWPKNNKPVNKAQPKFRKVMKQKFPEPDVVRITCDVHNWMVGYVIVAGHPYFALSDDSGAFKIANVPAGTYTINYWHETLGKQTAKVTVPASGSVTADKELAPAN